MSEKKEIKECIKELDACYDKLYKYFCEGKLCIGCPIGEPYCGCLLRNLEDLIDALEEKQQ